MKLKDLYPKLSVQKREQLARAAGTSPGYLWQLATGWRGKRPSVELIGKLAAADKRLKIAHLVEEFAERSAQPAAVPAHEPASA